MSVSGVSVVVNLRAEVAMREEDVRIARKHRDEAGARTVQIICRPGEAHAGCICGACGENESYAYAGAEEWLEVCMEAEASARARLIAACRPW
jgi:hypothetical protein